jgi:predicted nucleotidyltransferase
MITINRTTKTVKAKDYRPKGETPTRHARATSWEGLTEANQKLFKSVASEIKSKYPQANCYAFGSRVNGTYRDDSDIDMLISGVTELEYNKIKASIKHELNIDLKLGNEHSKQLIQIP